MSAEEEVCRDGELFPLSLVVSEMSVRECVSELPRGGGGGAHRGGLRKDVEMLRMRRITDRYVMAAVDDSAGVSGGSACGLTHLPRRAQVDEAVLLVKLRRRENIRDGERRLRIYDFVNISGWFCRRRHGGPNVSFVGRGQFQKLIPLDGLCLCTRPAKRVGK